MRFQTSDKIIAWLTLLSGLTISAVAVWYSVAGLVSIFAAAVVPIIVMGVALEVSKLIATVWLKLNWQRAPVFIRSYLLAAIAILMVITSMGIFGYLSKAHSDQSLVSGDVQSRIAIYDEKIKTSKENIDANRKALKQMDEAVDQSMARSTSETGADKAVAIRRGQAKERSRLQAEIAQEQKNISQLNEEAAPIRAEVRKVEAEVGPIKYIAAFIYGDNPDANILEKAVTWVIIIIVSVFDPLAVILLLASQYSFQWFRKQEEEQAEGDSLTTESGNNIVVEPTVTEPEVDLTEVNMQLAEAAEEVKERIDPHPIGWMYPKHANIVDYRVAEDADEEVVEEFDVQAHARQHIPEEEKTLIDDVGVETWNKMIAEAEAEVNREKEAMRQWKEENPDDTIKHQEKLKEAGVIEQLPWEGDLDRPGDYLTDSDSKKKTTYIVKEKNHQVTKTKE